jgi:hypothetical protein
VSDDEWIADLVTADQRVRAVLGLRVGESIVTCAQRVLNAREDSVGVAVARVLLDREAGLTAVERLFRAARVARRLTEREETPDP